MEQPEYHATPQLPIKISSAQADNMLACIKLEQILMVKSGESTKEAQEECIDESTYVPPINPVRKRFPNIKNLKFIINAENR
ncbi:MAG: hypothetical protein LBD57_01965 [Endomicrobium sp.]|nr:hypothetical protein [Endomicrobium sp.]